MRVDDINTRLYYDGWNDGYKQGRADVLKETKEELIDLIQGNEEFVDWQKREVCLCIECAIETLKEQSDESWDN